MARRAVFIDRDGTLIVERGYLDRRELVELLPGSLEAVRLLKDAGFLVVMVTNQAGVARGLFGEDFVRETHAWLQDVLSEQGAGLDGYYYCPHHPDGVIEAYRLACGCRKPAPGMIEQAARELDLDVPRSYVVGDRWLDVGLAVNAGATGLMVRTGYGRHEGDPPAGVTAATIVDDLLAAARWIVEQEANREPE